MSSPAIAETSSMRWVFCGTLPPRGPFARAEQNGHRPDAREKHRQPATFMPEVDLAPEVVEDSTVTAGDRFPYRPLRDDAAVEGIVQHDLELSSVHLEAPFRCPGAFGPCVSFRKMLAPS